jgi:hypothetical protein
MSPILGYIVLLILIALLLIRVVINRVYKSRYEENLDSEHEVNREIKTRLLRMLALFGMTITSGMAFIGLLIMFSSITDEARLTGNFMDDVFPIIVNIVLIIVGIFGTIGVVHLYKKIGE